MTLRDFLFHIVLHPIIVITLFSVFTLLYWGGSIVAIGLIIFMLFIVGIGSLLLRLFFRKKDKSTRPLIIGCFTLFVAVSIQGYVFYESTPNKLKSSILTPSLMDKFDATKGRIRYSGLEFAITIELQSSAELTREFLNSREYEAIEQSSANFSDSPKWFHESIEPEDSAYEYIDYSTEQIYQVVVKSDQNTIYAYYIAY